MRPIKVTTALFLLVFTSFFVAYGKDMIIISEDWESYEVGDNPHKPWKTTTGNKDFAVIKEDDGNKYLQLQGQDFSGSAGIYWGFEHSLVSGTIIFEMKFRGNRKTQVTFQMKDEENNTQIYFLVDEKRIITTSCDLMPVCGYFEDDEAFVIKIIIDMDKDRYSISVNGTQEDDYCTHLPSFQCNQDGEVMPMSSIKKISLGGLSSSYNAIEIDDIRMDCMDCKFKEYDDNDDACGC